MHDTHFTENQRLNEGHGPQMQLLSIQQAADLDDAICISAMGTVSSINTEEASFVMHLTQYVLGGIPHELTVHAKLAKNTKWANPRKRVPQEKAIVSVWGTLQRLDKHMVSLNEASHGIIVDVDDIQYMYNPENKDTEKPSSPCKKKNDLQQKFNRKDRKQNTTLPKPSTSQVQLGKRKAASSDDEVEKQV